MNEQGIIKFGLGQLTNATPTSAKWVFRGYFIISKAFIGWSAAVGIFSTHDLFIITTTVMLLLDPVMLGFSNLFGIDQSADTPPAKIPNVPGVTQL